MGNIRNEWLMKATESRFDWLNDKADGWQFGETGMLEAISERLNPALAVEIGAGDGQSLPLTLGFLLEKGVKTILFERDELRQSALKMTKKTAFIAGEFDAGALDGYCTVVGLHLSKAFVVIDVDGKDWCFAEQVLKIGRPQIMMIEHYDECGSGSGCAGLPPDWLLGHQLAEGGFIIQATWPEMQKRMRYFGYTLTARSRVNSLYVRDDLLPALEG